MSIALRETLASGAIILGIALTAGSAQAHSKSEMTIPADGTVVQVSPQTIGMNFDNPMRITLITLRDAAGEEHDLARSDEMAPVTQFRAVPEPLPLGRYTIEWRGLSADGHPMEGKFSFEIEG